MKKYRDLYKEEKRQHEETLQRYQEDHMDEMKIINLHQRCNKTDTKAAAKTGAKAAPKAPRSGYHLFMRELLDEMTGEDRKSYRRIVLRRWKEIKEDPERLSAYNDMARQMKNEAEKLGDDSSVHKKTVAERPAVKQSQKESKTPELVDTGSGNKDPKKTSPEPVHKEPAKPAKKLPVAGRTLVTSCTYILTSGVRKGNQCRLKASDKTDKFCNYRKRQT